MTVGYNEPLYVLPFDHRASFSKNLGERAGPRGGARSSRTEVTT
jgi:hypothetical protein